MITVPAGGAVEALRRSADEDWAAAVGHRFVEELFAGTVPDEVMATYLIQDYQFFEDFLAMLGACVAHADRIEAKLRFARQLGFLEADEDSYFVRAFAEVRVSPEDYADPVLLAPTAGFRDVMKGAVASASYPDLLVVLVIAEWLYLDWGELERDMPLAMSTSGGSSSTAVRTSPPGCSSSSTNSNASCLEGTTPRRSRPGTG